MADASTESTFLDTSEMIPARWYRPLQPWIESVSGISGINEVYAKNRGRSTVDFAIGARDHLGVEWEIDENSLPESDGRGRLVLSNHPTGLIEGLVLYELLEKMSPGSWKLLGNTFVASKPELAPQTIPLDPFYKNGGMRVNTKSLRQAFKVLKSGGTLGAFPAGRVAGRLDGEGRAVDQPWTPHLVRIARKTGARVFLVRMPWKPGRLLRMCPVNLPSLRALFLFHEALRDCKRERLVCLQEAPDNLPVDDEEATRLLEKRCHELIPA